jgi:hypothetical protein
MIILPRQARDKHRKNSKRDAFLYINCRTRGHDSHLEDERLRKRVRFLIDALRVFVSGTFREAAFALLLRVAPLVVSPVILSCLILSCLA